jgi:hypothetical protein
VRAVGIVDITQLNFARANRNHGSWGSNSIFSVFVQHPADKRVLR